MKKIPLFVELCAGLASVSGVLQHGSMWKPPISRMGRKSGYADAILRVMGLKPRSGAERYLWAEADSDVAALLAAYTQPEVMRQIAEIIRSWIPCPYGPHEGWCARCKGTGRWDARDLWETLRREKRRGLWEGGGSAEDVAQYAVVAEGCHEVRANGGTSGFKNERADGGYYKDHSILLPRFAALPWPPVLIAQDARIEPGEVAGWIYGSSCAFDSCKMARSGWRAGGFLSPEREVYQWPREKIADGCASPVWPPVHLTPDAAIQPSQIPAGTVVYMDPPYAGTTGYKHNLDRAKVIAIAQRGHAAGARVYISEAEPIEIKGWHHVDIGGERKGQARTFGHTQEWLTCSHPPAWTPPKQHGLFG